VKLIKTSVYPNIFIKGKSDCTGIVFDALTDESKINIYTVSGKLIKTIEHKSSSGSEKEEWNLSSTSGEEVSSGIYLYVITSAEGIKKGKISVIK